MARCLITVIGVENHPHPNLPPEGEGEFPLSLEEK
jgi:hypothetical protein